MIAEMEKSSTWRTLPNTSTPLILGINPLGIWKHNSGSPLHLFRNTGENCIFHFRNHKSAVWDFTRTERTVLERKIVAIPLQTLSSAPVCVDHQGILTCARYQCKEKASVWWTNFTAKSQKNWPSVAKVPVVRWWHSELSYRKLAININSSHMQICSFCQFITAAKLTW